MTTAALWKAILLVGSRCQRSVSPLRRERYPEADLPETLKEPAGRLEDSVLARPRLVAKGELIGKFMTYYGTASPYIFGKAEIDLASPLLGSLA